MKLHRHVDLVFRELVLGSLVLGAMFMPPKLLGQTAGSHLMNYSRAEASLPQGLKPAILLRFSARLEAVPFRKTVYETASDPLILAQAQTSQSPAQPEATPATPDSPDVAKLRADLKMAQDKLKDWPNLGRYRDANAQVQPPAAGENRVVFMGDSITDGWGHNNDKFFPGKPYINRGISGQTTPQMLIRFRPDVIALKPKVVVILAGTNDLAGNTGPSTLEAIENNLTSMAELAKVNGIRVVLASLLPISDYIKPQTNRRSPEQIVALNAWMKDYAGKNGLVYLDYYSSLLDDKKMFKQELTRDGLHPNDAGYAIMGPLAEKAIGEALRETPAGHKGSSKKVKSRNRGK